MFASRSIAVHLMRGVAGLALVVWAFSHQFSHPVLAIAAAVAALVSLGGCPLCWVVGLVVTINDRLHARPTHGCRCEVSDDLLHA